MKSGKAGLGLGAIWLVAICGLLLAGCHFGKKNSEFADIPGVTGPEQPSYGDAVGVRQPSATPTASTPAQPNAPVPGSTEGNSAEVLQPGDTISVSISDIATPIAPMEQTVKSDGTITLWFNQTFHVAGKSRGQVEREIQIRYVPPYFRQATFTVTHQAQSRFYYVGGEVKAPGRQLWIGPITVTRAIQSAGDFTDFANKKNVELIHSNGKKETVNCKKALDHPEVDLPVYPGDKIHVKRRWL